MKRLAISFLLVVQSLYGFSQSTSRNNLEVSLIYKIIQHISWNNPIKGKYFTIGVLSNDSSLINSFVTLVEIANFDGKKGKVLVYNSPDVDTTLRVLFVGEHFQKSIARMWSANVFHNTLLITENYADEKYAMINLKYLEQESKYSFTVNKTNILIGNLMISNEALLLGGTQIDMRDLYLKVNEELEQEQSNTQALRKTIVQQRFTIDSNRAVSESLKVNISNQEKLLKMSKKSLDFQQHLMDSLGRSIFAKQNQNEIQARIIKERAKIILEQEDKIDSSNKELFRLGGKLSESTNKLNAQNIDIASKDTLIRKQQFRLLVVAGTLLFLAFLMLVIFILLRNRIRLNRELSQKNDLLSSQQLQIKDKNEELQAVNEELQSLNEELYSNREELIAQKEKLEVALEELKLSQDRLIQAEKMSSLGMLTAGIAHELKNPLNYISTGVYALETILTSFARQLENWKKNQDANAGDDKNLSGINFDRTLVSVEKVKTGILEGVTRSSNIIESLNIYSHTGDSITTETDVVQCIEKALTILFHQYKNKIEIIRHYQEDLTMLASEVKLVQLFTNIFSNAIDAIEDKGTIEINARKEGTRVLIDIRDSGKGVDPLLIPHLFDPFFTTKEVGKGTGLGLSIVYIIVKQHNGEVQVESVPGSHTIFHFRFPRK